VLSGNFYTRWKIHGLLNPQTHSSKDAERQNLD
jgi:hypothetical protein